MKDEDKLGKHGNVDFDIGTSVEFVHRTTHRFKLTCSIHDNNRWTGDIYLRTTECQEGEGQ